MSCNVEPCPDEDGDFRAKQCADNNDKPLDGNYFKVRRRKFLKLKKPIFQKPSLFTLTFPPDPIKHPTLVQWRPYVGKNRCELTCKPETASFYYKWADKVIDGTKCDTLGEEVCVDGVCLPVGCDGKLGSTAKNDKCGVCKGDESKCKSVEGTFDDRSLAPGYHDVVTIPAGATAVRVEEARPSGNR